MEREELIKYILCEPCPIVNSSFSAPPGLRPEEHQAAGLRCLECLDGYEHHFEGEERDPVDWPPDKFSTGMSEPRVGEATPHGQN